MRQVYQAQDLTDAHLIRGLLDGNGIEAVVQGEPLAGALGELPFNTTAPSVWVLRDEDHDTARRLVEAQGRQVYPTHCPGCGYDLTGLPEPRCPECGRPFPRREQWMCPSCGETLEGQFTECWNCGAARDPQPPSNP